jgi:hypothetical protein
MTFDRVNSVQIRPDKVATFQQQVAELATAASEGGEAFRWTAHQTLFGEGMTMHFVSQSETFEEIEKQGQVDALWLRVLGDERGREGFERANGCLQAVQQVIAVDRPDLSYAEAAGTPGEYPYAIVTEARARPGHAEACEELIRKVAEAIPKVDDPARMMTYQVIVGAIGTYWTIRPLRRLADLDAQLPAPQLLEQAFGNAEGGLLWRNGTEAIEQGRREILRFVPELSNPPAT